MGLILITFDNVLDNIATKNINILIRNETSNSLLTTYIHSTSSDYSNKM